MMRHRPQQVDLRRVEKEAEEEFAYKCHQQASKLWCCCEKRCLISYFNDNNRTDAFVRECLTEVKSMTRKEKRQYLLNKINDTCIKDFRKKTNTAIMNWTVGSKAGQRVEVCKSAFLICYDIGHTFADALVAIIKTNAVYLEKPLNDKTRHDESLTDDIVRMAAGRGHILSKEKVAMMRIQNSAVAMACYVWMDHFFDLVGDQIPNSCGEVHLEPMPIKDVWEEYVTVMISANDDYLGYKQFIVMWYVCFPHVKVREYKAVTGKCDTCALLTAARQQHRDSAGRELITYFHSIHRSMYMSERKQYHERRYKAIHQPSKYMSIISDGMAQTHCELPHMCNQSQFKSKLPQHLQGVLNHGRDFTIYRTFHSVPHDSNLQVHCFLLNLEATYNHEENRLPDTIYYQIDGGSENTAKVVLAICELLVAKRITKQIVITRLPVGHTHEDIDSRFGILWTANRNRPIHTPQEYVRRIHQAYGNSLPIKVVDIWAVPNYTVVMEPFIDPKFERYCKNEWTQLQWTVDAVEPCADFPCGVKTTYRMYSSDTVFEILKDENHDIGFSEREVEVRTYPEAKPIADDNGPARPAGMYILQHLPDVDIIPPMGNITGSRHMLENTMNRVKSYFNPVEVQEWAEFEAMAPKSDDIMEYLSEHPDELRVPFSKILFNASYVGSDASIPPVNSKRLSDRVPIKHIAAPTVVWSNRGDRCKPCGRPTLPADPSINDPSENIIARARKSVMRKVNDSTSEPKNSKSIRLPKDDSATNIVDTIVEPDEEDVAQLFTADVVFDDGPISSSTCAPDQNHGDDNISALECTRVANIQRNEAYLGLLGVLNTKATLLTTASETTLKKKRERKSHPSDDLTAPLRKSTRSAAAAATARIAETAAIEKTGRGPLLSTLPSWLVDILSKANPSSEESDLNCEKLRESYKGKCFKDDSHGELRESNNSYDVNDRVVLDIAYNGTVENLRTMDQTTEKTYCIDLPQYVAITDYIDEANRHDDSKECFIIDRDGEFDDMLNAYRPEGKLNKYEPWEKQLFQKAKEKCVSKKDFQDGTKLLLEKYLGVCFIDIVDGVEEERIVLDVLHQTKAKHYCMVTDFVSEDLRRPGEGNASSQELYVFHEEMHDMIAKYQLTHRQFRLH